MDEQELFDAPIEEVGKDNETTEAYGSDEVVSLIDNESEMYSMTYDSFKFKGDYLDIRASRFVIRKAQAKAIYTSLGTPLIVKEAPKNTLQFGLQNVPSIGRAKFLIPHANTHGTEIFPG